MQKKLVLLLSVPLLIQCASQETSSAEVRTTIEKDLKDQVGVATKTEFVEKYGTPQWCDPKPSGEETCLFHQKKGTQWLGENRDKKSHELYDQVVADFDTKGRLRTYEVKSQR